MKVAKEEERGINQMIYQIQEGNPSQEMTDFIMNIPVS